MPQAPFIAVAVFCLFLFPPPPHQKKKKKQVAQQTRCDARPAFTATKLVVKAPRQKRQARLEGEAPKSARTRSTSRQAVGISYGNPTATSRWAVGARRWALGICRIEFLVSFIKGKKGKPQFGGVTDPLKQDGWKAKESQRSLPWVAKLLWPDIKLTSCKADGLKPGQISGLKWTLALGGPRSPGPRRRAGARSRPRPAPASRTRASQSSPPRSPRTGGPATLEVPPAYNCCSPVRSKAWPGHDPECEEFSCFVLLLFLMDPKMQSCRGTTSLGASWRLPLFAQQLAQAKERTTKGVDGREQVVLGDFALHDLRRRGR